jgi:hypothetical protein
MTYKTGFTTYKMSFDYGNFQITLALQGTLISEKDPKELISGDSVQVEIDVRKNLNILQGNSRNGNYNCKVWFSGEGADRKINFTVFHSKKHYLTFYADVNFAQKTS